MKSNNNREGYIGLLALLILQETEIEQQNRNSEGKSE